MSFLPEGFEPPAGLDTERVRIRPISIHDAVKDYDAVMSNRAQLWDLFGEAWGWPPESMTLEEDLIDLAWHQKEGQLRRSFNYAVLTLDESALLGCIYIDPPERADVDAEVAYWVRADRDTDGLGEHVAQVARSWVADAWPFDRVAYPGRDEPW